MQSLCTLRNHCRQWPRNTRHQADATPYLGRTSTGWIAPALPGALILSSRRRGRDTENTGGLSVDYQLERGRLHDWQVRRLCSSEDTTYINAHLSPSISDIGTIAYQPTSFWNFACCRYYQNDMRRRQIRKLDAPAREERIGSEEQRVEPLAYQNCKSRINFAGRLR